jgi:hypothetical protein
MRLRLTNGYIAAEGGVSGVPTQFFRTVQLLRDSFGLPRRAVKAVRRFFSHTADVLTNAACELGDTHCAHGNLQGRGQVVMDGRGALGDGSLRRSSPRQGSQQCAGTIPDDLHADAEQDERGQSQQNAHPRLSDHPAQPLRVAIRDKHRGGHERYTDQCR